MSHTHRLTRRSVRRGLTLSAAMALALALLPGVATAQDAPAVVDPEDACQNAPEDTAFTDIDGNTFEDEIVCLAFYGITQGKTDTTYVPGEDVSRAQMASFFARLIAGANALEADGVDLEELPAYDDDNAFTDVGDDSEHVETINQLADAGIVEGFGDGTYGPGQDISRGQMAAFIDRTQDFLVGGLEDDEDGFDAPADANYFEDDDGTFHEEAINDIASVGITRGDDDGNYRPSDSVNRGQMSAFIMRHVEVNVDAGAINPLPAPSTAGVITAENDGANTLTYTLNGESITVTYEDSDEFSVDGEDVSVALFEADTSVGDLLTVGADSDSDDDADTFSLENVDTSTLSEGVVGNVDIASTEFDLIEPVSGVALRADVDYSGGLYSVDGSTVTESGFGDDLNEGDTVEITDDDGTLTFGLTNLTVSGEAAAAATDAPGEFRIGALGDLEADGTDDDYDSDGATITIDGEDADEAAFDLAISVGDAVTYARADDAVTITLENLAPSADEGFVADLTGLGAFDIVEADGTIVQDDLDATGLDEYRVDGTLVTEGEAGTALTADDYVEYQPGDPAAEVDSYLHITNRTQLALDDTAYGAQTPDTKDAVPFTGTAAADAEVTISVDDANPATSAVTETVTADSDGDYSAELDLTGLDNPAEDGTLNALASYEDEFDEFTDTALVTFNDVA